jgi:hypothetical protein
MRWKMDLKLGYVYSVDNLLEMHVENLENGAIIE